MKKITPYAIPGVKTELDQIISECFGTTVEQMRSRTKKPPHATARQFAMWFYQIYLDHSEIQAGKIYDRDHSTAHSAKNLIWNLMETDKAFKSLADKTVDLIRAIGIIKKDDKMKLSNHGTNKDN
jgi:chromosomal replication initiation ATPase DnaA